MALDAVGVIWSKLQLEKVELPLMRAAMRKSVAEVEAQAPPASPSCGAPKVWPTSCAATSASKVIDTRASERLAP